MNRHFFTGAFLLGLVALVWVGAGFIGSNLMALLMTVFIGAVYGFGAFELRQYRQATTSLATALTAIPQQIQNLEDWLASVHPSLRNPVRLRIEGERIGLPGPALTPYLVGLLVMMGMLGTFLGMVVTLNGAVSALERTADLQAMRSAFAAPIKGLGLAFGTSVAGVASSAMLGLMSAVSRRERMQTAQQLDSRIATVLRGFSLTHQRQETFKALQFQSRALPQVVDQLELMMAQMARMSQQLNDQLLSKQENFHTQVASTYTELANSVDKSLRDSLAQSAQLTGESLKSVVEVAMAGMAQEAKWMHERMIDTTQAQLTGLSERVNTSADTLANTLTAAVATQEKTNTTLVTSVGHSLAAFNDTFGQRSSALVTTLSKTYVDLQADHSSNDQQRLATWMDSLEKMATQLNQEWRATGAQSLAQQQEICNTLNQTAQTMSEQAQASANQTLGDIARLTAGSEELIRSRIDSEARWLDQHSARMDQLATLLRTELGGLREDEALRSQAAAERLGELQTAVAGHLTNLGTAMEDPITRLIQTASEAPRAAAEVIGQLRQQISGSVARDNELLEERSRIMETLNSLLGAINHASVEQRAVIDALVASSAVALTDAGSRFSDKVDSEAGKLSDIAAHVTSSAVDVSSLSATFGLAVSSFNEANEKLISNLQRIEGALDKSMTRSDEQLAYYVAQAREIIDLSVMSQKEIFEELRQWARKQAVLTEEVA